MVASNGDGWPARMADAHCVGKSAVVMLSLTASLNGLACGGTDAGAVESACLRSKNS